MIMVARTNPVSLASSESDSSYDALVVTPEQMIVSLNELESPQTRLEWTLALLHAATALRPEETFGLKWVDIDWRNSQIHISRAWSKGNRDTGKEQGQHDAGAHALCSGQSSQGLAS